MSTVSQFDVQGYAIPFAADDEVIECGPDDPGYGEPETWESWTDAHTWELGPAIPPDAELEPFAPSLADELDYAEWAAEVDRRWRDERIERGYPAEFQPSYVTDADLAAAGLAVG